MTFSALLRTARARSRLTSRSVARHVGIHPTVYSRIETGHHAPPSLDRTLMLAEHLAIPREDLVRAWMVEAKRGDAVAEYLRAVSFASTPESP